MTSPRHRRLLADAKRMHEAYTGHSHVTVEPLGPAPAERYRVMYSVPGLLLTPDNRVARTHVHVVEIYLPASYPREKPYCVAQTPVFHPNFGSHVCIADYWSPAQSLVDVVVQMGEMLQWQVYNTRSPLNAVAARWAAENTHQLPVGMQGVHPLADLAVSLADVTVPLRPVAFSVDPPAPLPSAPPAPLEPAPVPAMTFGPLLAVPHAPPAHEATPVAALPLQPTGYSSPDATPLADLAALVGPETPELERLLPPAASPLPVRMPRSTTVLPSF